MSPPSFFSSALVAVASFAGTSTPTAARPASRCSPRSRKSSSHMPSPRWTKLPTRPPTTQLPTTPARRASPPESTVATMPRTRPKPAAPLVVSRVPSLCALILPLLSLARTPIAPRFISSFAFSHPLSSAAAWSAAVSLRENRDNELFKHCCYAISSLFLGCIHSSCRILMLFPFSAWLLPFFCTHAEDSCAPALPVIDSVEALTSR